MAKLRVNWAPDEMLPFSEVLKAPGWYLNAVSGTIWKHVQHPAATDRQLAAIEAAQVDGVAPGDLDARIWLRIPAALGSSEAEVRAVLRDVFHLPAEAQGRLVSSRP